MNLITDNVKRNDGQILWDGTDILKLGKRFRAKLGYMPQQQGMYNDFSARAFLRYMAQTKEISKMQANEQIEQLLDLVNLREDAHKKVGGFSGGMRQRVLLVIGEICFALSSRCSKNRDAILVCCAVLLIPAALAAIGSTVGELLSFLIPLGGSELFMVLF